MFVKAKKHLGQHFLTDEGIAKDIANALTGIGYDDVLEIGPGMGVLTKYLLQQKAKITVMELDRESVAYLHDTFPLEHIKLDTSAAHFSVLEGDFLKKEIKEIFQKTEFGPGYVVVVRRGFLDLNFDELRKSLTTALGKNLD